MPGMEHLRAMSLEQLGEQIIFCKRTEQRAALLAELRRRNEAVAKLAKAARSAIGEWDQADEDVGVRELYGIWVKNLRAALAAFQEPVKP